MKNNITNYTNVIYMLSTWATSGMWKDNVLLDEINITILKLLEPLCQLTERELFITQELTNGLLEATLSTFDKVDDLQRNELAEALYDITIFQSFLNVDINIH